MIKPTIGRVVWFWPEGDRPSDPHAQPLAAIVTHVWGDNCVNLVVFTSSGETLPRTSVQLYQAHGPRPPNYAFCEWMPFQLGQAKAQLGTTG